MFWNKHLRSLMNGKLSLGIGSVFSSQHSVMSYGCRMCYQSSMARPCGRRVDLENI